MRKHTHSIDGNQIISTSTYASQPVVGIAKCHPDDNLDISYGKRLADARCDFKIACKRRTRARQKYREALEAYKKHKAYLDKMTAYKHDTELAVKNAAKDLNDILDEAR